MDIHQYKIQLKQTINKLIEQNEFEVCKMATELLECIENKNTSKYIKTQFDIKTLTKVGFLKKGMTEFEISERLCRFFDLNNVFEYSIRGGMFCPYERYANGFHEIITKCIW